MKSYIIVGNLLRIAICGIAVLFAGCGDPGPPMGTVHGKLTIGGAPPPEPVLINFVNSAMGTGGGAQTEADGSFNVEFPMRTGEYTIYFLQIVESQGPVSTDQEVLKIVPKEYGSEMTSPLKEMVEEGANEINIDVPKA